MYFIRNARRELAYDIQQKVCRWVQVASMGFRSLVDGVLLRVDGVRIQFGGFSYSVRDLLSFYEIVFVEFDRQRVGVQRIAFVEHRVIRIAHQKHDVIVVFQQGSFHL